MSYLCYVVFVGVSRCPSHIVLCILIWLSSSCVPNVASFSGLSILVCPFGFRYSLSIQTQTTQKEPRHWCEKRLFV